MDVQKIWMSDIHGISVSIKSEFKIYFADNPKKTKFYNGGVLKEQIYNGMAIIQMVILINNI